MRRFAKVAVSVPSEQLDQVHRIVDSGEFGSAAELLRAALAAFLERRRLHAGLHGARRLGRTIRDHAQATLGEAAERVELLFDAGDAKA